MDNKDTKAAIPFATVAQKGNRVIVKFVNKPNSRQDILSYLDEIKKIYDKNEKFIIMYNAQHIGLISLDNMKLQANFMREQEERTKELMVRAAVVVNGQAQRLLLQTLFKIKKPACPLKVCDTVEKASEYLRQSTLDNISS